VVDFELDPVEGSEADQVVGLAADGDGVTVDEVVDRKNTDAVVPGDGQAPDLLAG
jgi:hypothetical protein